MKKGEKVVEGDNSFGVSSVIMGILSILDVFFVPFVGIALAILGVIFSVQQKKRGENNWSKAGMILSVIGIILSIAIIVLSAWFIVNNPELLSQIRNLQP